MRWAALSGHAEAGDRSVSFRMSVKQSGCKFMAWAPDEISAVVGAELERYRPELRATVRGQPKLEVYVHLTDDMMVVGLSISRSPLSLRLVRYKSKSWLFQISLGGHDPPHTRPLLFLLHQPPQRALCSFCACICGLRYYTRCDQHRFVSSVTGTGCIKYDPLCVAITRGFAIGSLGRSYNRNPGMRTTVAWCLCVAAEILPGARVCDPTCGKATILVEAAINWKPEACVGCDIDHRAISEVHTISRCCGHQPITRTHASYRFVVVHTAVHLPWYVGLGSHRQSKAHPNRLASSLRL